MESNEFKSIKSESHVESGRFVFSSRKALSETINELKNKDEEVVEQEFEKLYQKGFRPHKPILSSENRELQNKFYQERLQKRKSKGLFAKNLEESTSLDDENDGEFIADPGLAAVVNEDSEIIVNDTLYKFTEEKGLFFTHIKDSTALLNYFKQEDKETNNLNSKTSFSVYKNPCELRTTYAGVTKVNNLISRYIRPIDDECTTSGIGKTFTPPQLTEEEKLQKIISELPQCSGNDNWFQNIFGKNYRCINYFDSKTRINTEFWDQNWLVYKSVGAQTKTQTKKLGIWWASNSDEVHLGINRVFLKYKYPKPDIASITHAPLFTKDYQAPIYMYNGTFKVMGDNFMNNTFSYIDSQITVTKNSLPFFAFDDAQILNIYIPKVPLIKNYELDLKTKDILSESNIKNLYKMGIDFLKDKFNSGAKKDFAITYQKSDEEIEVIYFGERYYGLNDNKIERKFYSDLSFLIGGAWGENSGWKFSVKPGKDVFRKYTHYEVDVYGMARRGSTWKGNRMVR